MKLLLSMLFVLASPAWAFDREPDEIFLRHARALVPQFLEEQSRAFGVSLHVDLDSLRVEDQLASPLLLGLMPVEHSAYVYFGPWQMTARCRRIDGVITEREARATFFVRSMPSHYALVRSCAVDDVRPPLLIVDHFGRTFHHFTDAEIIEHVKPLVTRLVLDQAAGAEIDPQSFRVKWPWFDPRVDFTDPRGLLDGSPGRDCRRLDFTMPVTHQRGSVTVAIAYDTNDILPKVPLAYQLLLQEPNLLRRFRFALVKGCAFWNRAEPPVMGFRRL